MRKAVKLILIHDGGAHVEGHAGLMPYFGDGPLAVCLLRTNAADAAIFSSDQNAATVNRGSRHILIGSHVRKRELPEEFPCPTINADNRAMIPFNQLFHAAQLRKQGRGIRRTVLAVFPDLLAGGGIQRDQNPRFVSPKMHDHPTVVHNRRR